MAAVFSNTTKLMLKNVIRHTTSHNKTVEESDMWQQLERKKGLGGLDPSNPSYGHDDRCAGRGERDRRRNDYWNSRSEKRAYLSTSSRSRRAHMDEEHDKSQRGSSTSTYWMRQLEKLETSDPNRWDHSGYKELYPNDYRCDRSDSDSSPPRVAPHRPKKDRAKKRKKQRSKSKKRRQEKKSSSSSRPRRKQGGKRRAPSSSDESDSSESSSFTSDSSHPRPHGKGQHVSRKRHYDRTKAGRNASSDSGSGSYVDSYSDSRERSQSRRRRQSRRTPSASASRRQHYGSSSKPGRRTSSDSSSGSYSDSDSGSCSRERVQSRRVKPRKRRTTQSSSGSTSCSGRTVSSSSPLRKKVKTEKLTPKKKTKSKKGSKHKT